MRFKAISLWQPWATLMALNKKRVETRSWHTNQRGLVAIHAAKKWNDNLVLTCTGKCFGDALGVFREDYDSVINFKKYLTELLPFGAIVAIGTLAHCEQITSQNSPDDFNEYVFGDYTPGRFMWIFEKIIKLPEPIPYTGRQGFFNVDERVSEEIIVQTDCLMR